MASSQQQDQLHLLRRLEALEMQKDRQREELKAALDRLRSEMKEQGEPAAAFAQMLLERLAIARDDSQSSTRQGELGGAVRAVRGFRDYRR